MRLREYEAIRYIIVGIINTAVGYSVIFILMFLNYNAYIANFCGYAVGIICSFMLNKFYTFKSNESNTMLVQSMKFLLSVLISYLLNLLVLFICLKLLTMNKYMAQIFAGCAYVIVGYLLNKFYVFMPKNDE